MEEFIFDDEMNDVGAEIEAHCPKCHSTAHTIVSKYEDEVRRVQCNSCGHVHPYKKPRDEDEVEVPPVKKKAQKAKPTYDQVMAKSKKPPRPYNIGEYFKELEIVSHPKFGVGYVTENIGNDKIEVTFQADKRVLIHNRKGLNLPVAALRPFEPQGPKSAKGKKGVVAKAAPPPPAPPAKKGAKAAAPAAKDKKAVGRASTVRPAKKPARPAPRAAKPARPTRPVAKKKATGKPAKSAPKAKAKANKKKR